MNIPRQRGWVAFLILVHLVGSLYGFYWYGGQLLTTPARYWPVVPDSPGSTLLFTFFLVALYAGRRLRWLEGLAYLSMFKYGLWSVFLFSHFWVTQHYATFESIHLSLSHFAMAVEAVLFMVWYRPGRVWGFLALGWLLFNDLMDYVVLGTHPTLPVPGALGYAAVTAFGLSFVAFLVFLGVTGGKSNDRRLPIS